MKTAQESWCDEPINWQERWCQCWHCSNNAEQSVHALAPAAYCRPHGHHPPSHHPSPFKNTHRLFFLSKARWRMTHWWMTHYKVLCLTLSGMTRADITKKGLSENRGFLIFFLWKTLQSSREWQRLKPLGQVLNFSVSGGKSSYCIIGKVRE